MTIKFAAPDETAFWHSIDPQHLKAVTRGLEKESLRVNSEGHLALTPHPESLGSALTHQYITTDYSEALLEFITPPTQQRFAPIQQLHEIHHFVYHSIGDEHLWASSMPCVMGDDDDIPIARYGHSNSGQMKEIYRLGLGLRYGRFMQTIAGVHYNFSYAEPLLKAIYQQSERTQSYQDFKSERYLGVIRNFLRHGWVLPLLFGASPALCESFLQNRSSNLKELFPGTRFGKYATSLRMSDLGYQNNAQSSLTVSSNSLDAYVRDLEHAIRTEDNYYRKIGIKKNGAYQQLNANLLQIENEFYSYIRPKRSSQSGERPTKALRERGIEYIEIRALDIDPFSPVGISQSQLDFIDVFMLHCLIRPSAKTTLRDTAEHTTNFSRVVNRGRDPQLMLIKNNQDRCINEWCQELFSEFAECARLYDAAYDTQDFSHALEKYQKIVGDRSCSASSRLLEQIGQPPVGFFDTVQSLSKEFAEEFRARTLSQEITEKYLLEAKQSQTKQALLEQDQSKTFEQFLADYFSD